MGRIWLEVISNTELWDATAEKPTVLEIKMRKSRWFGRTLRKGDGPIEKQALDWNPQGTRRRGRPR
jgi:hypothetical protein